MKHIIIAVLLFALATGARADPEWETGISQTEQATRGLISYWSMRNSGTTVYDEISTNDGTAVGGVTFSYANGVVGNGGGFDGSTAYIDMGDVTSMDGATSATFMAWIYPHRLDREQAFVRKWMAAAQAFMLGLSNDDNDEFVLAITDGSNVLVVDTTGDPVSVNTWQHIAAVWHGGNTATMYYNGVEQSSVITVNGSPTAIANVTEHLSIGARYNAGAEDLHFDGYIDEVRIYDIAKTPAEVHQLYRMGRYPYDNR